MKILLCYWFPSKVPRGGTERAERAGTVAFPLEGVTLPMGLAGVHFLAQATVWALLLLLVILSHGREAFVQVVPTPCWPYSEPFSAHSSLALFFKARKLKPRI